MNLIRVLLHLRKCVHGRRAYVQDIYHSKVHNIIDSFFVQEMGLSNNPTIGDVRRVCYSLCANLNTHDAAPLRAMLYVTCSREQRMKPYVHNRQKVLNIVKMLHRVQVPDAIFTATLLQLQAEMDEFK